MTAMFMPDGRWRENVRLTRLAYELATEDAAMNAESQEDFDRRLDVFYGRSPQAEFERKRWMEEARRVSCPECGSYAGRHMRSCSRASR